MSNPKWVKLPNSEEFLNIETGAIIRASCKWDSHKWSWIPAIEHQVGDTKRYIFEGDAIRERKNAWYDKTEDELSCMRIAVDHLQEFMESIGFEKPGDGSTQA